MFNSLRMVSFSLSFKTFCLSLSVRQTSYLLVALTSSQAWGKVVGLVPSGEKEQKVDQLALPHHPLVFHASSGMLRHPSDCTSKTNHGDVFISKHLGPVCRIPHFCIGWRSSSHRSTCPSESIWMEAITPSLN